MPTVQACVLNFLPRSSAGTQTVTGVVDRDGNPFVGKVFLFNCTYVTDLDIVTSGTAGTGAYSDIIGVDTGAIRSGTALESLYTPFSFKGVAGGTSHGDDSIIDYWTTNFGSYALDRQARISSVSSGSFDVNFTSTYTSPTICPILVLVLGGDDCGVTFLDSVNGTYTTSGKPQGLLAMPLPGPASSGFTAGFVGGGPNPWGFATRDGVYGASTLSVESQGNNWTAQRTSGWNASMNGTTGVQNSIPIVSAWGDTSLSIANSDGVSMAIPMAICGDLVVTAGGSFNQPLSTGDQTIDLGIDAHVIFFWSIGQVTATSTYSSPGQQARGWATSTDQGGYWGGEATNGNTGPQTGARFLTDSSVLRFGTPTAGSTTFNSVASLTGIDSDAATATLHWSSVDGTAREILWFAIGEITTPPPPPPEPVFRTREVVRRRLRRAPIVWNEKGGLQTRVRINLFAVDMQPGVGTADTPDPLVMIRASKDGGFTWGSERRLTAGRVGEFFDRINAWQWGQGRDFVFEVSCTDPVTWNLMNCYIDAEGGDN